MPNFCPQCGGENPRCAKYCMYCGSVQTPTEKVNELDKLHQDLSDAQETIRLLKKALADAQKNNDSSVEHQQTIENLQKQIEKVQETEEQTYNIDHIQDCYTNIRTEIYEKKMFEHPFSFKGRIRRTEFCLSVLICFVYYLTMDIIDANEISAGFAIFLLLLLILMIWFLLAQGAKRCHDRNNPGWYQIIPFYGLWMLFAKGDKEENNYGAARIKERAKAEKTKQSGQCALEKRQRREAEGKKEALQIKPNDEYYEKQSIEDKKYLEKEHNPKTTAFKYKGGDDKQYDKRVQGVEEVKKIGNLGYIGYKGGKKALKNDIPTNWKWLYFERLYKWTSEFKPECSYIESNWIPITEFIAMFDKHQKNSDEDS